jgi:hypothetical protein
MTDVRAKDRREALKRHGTDCLKCGWNVRIEVQHVYGPEDRHPGNHHPLCYYCHLVAPMGDLYWAWEESGEPGWYPLAKKLDEIIIYHSLPPEQRSQVPMPRYGFGSPPDLPNQLEPKRRKPRSSPTAQSNSPPAELTASIRNWRLAGMSVAQIAHTLMKLKIAPCGGFKSGAQSPSTASSAPTRERLKTTNAPNNAMTHALYEDVTFNAMPFSFQSAGVQH